MKTRRQEALLKIIDENEIYTQEALQEKLKECGFDVTQATVSRDIKSLDLVKIASGDGKYRYAPKQLTTGVAVKKFTSVFQEAVIKVDYAINTVVVKCHTGMANAACAALDIMDLGDVVGTLAGDDTIFVLLRTEEKAKQVAEKINEMLGR